MSDHCTESHDENAVLQLFQEPHGNRYLYGSDADRDYHFPLYEAAYDAAPVLFAF